MIQIDQEDSERHAFYYWADALRILTYDAEMQCDKVGNYNVAWEIRDDVGSGRYIVKMKSLELTPQQNDQILELISALATLPEDAINPKDMKMTTRDGCLAAMRHPAWQPLREVASRLVLDLDPAIKRNDAYFKK